MPTIETVSFSLPNSLTLLDGVTDIGLVENRGHFLWWLSAAERFFLTARFCINYDFCGAHNWSSSNGMAGWLPLLPGSMSLAARHHPLTKLKY